MCRTKTEVVGEDRRQANTLEPIGRYYDACPTTD